MPNTMEQAFQQLQRENDAAPLRAQSKGAEVMDGGDAPQPETKPFVTPVSGRADAKPPGRPAAELDTALPEPGDVLQPAKAPRPQLTEEHFLRAIKAARAPQAPPEERAGLPGDTKATAAGLEGPSGTVKLNSAGQRQYQAAIARVKARYGRYPGHDDANGPHPEFAPGRPEFNPFRTDGDPWVLPEE